MVFDYNKTINRYTQLDAYPLPLIEDIVAKLAKYKVFSTINLKSAYHQIELNQRDREFAAFHLEMICIKGDDYPSISQMLYLNFSVPLMRLSNKINLKAVFLI